MKHEKAIDKILREIFFSECMNEDDYKEFLKKLFEATTLTKKKISDNIETGVKNGFPVDEQLIIMKKMFKV